MIVILSPHFDDAVLSCWTLLTGRDDVRVVNVFGASPSSDAPLGSWDAVTGARSSAERVAERVAEDRAVLERLGCEVVNLDLLDGQYTPEGRDSAHVLRAVGPAVARAERLYAPAAIGAHGDHADARAAAGALWRRGTPVSLYADLPYANRDGWPAWVDENGAAAVANEWEGDMAMRGERSLAPNHAKVISLSEAEQRAKLDAISGYRTQHLAYADMVSAEAVASDSVAHEVFWSLPHPTARDRLHRIPWRLGLRRGSWLDRLR